MSCGCVHGRRSTRLRLKHRIALHAMHMRAPCPWDHVPVHAMYGAHVHVHVPRLNVKCPQSRMQLAVTGVGALHPWA
eukprot:905494-Prymnesium_polylepis.1